MERYANRAMFCAAFAFAIFMSLNCVAASYSLSPTSVNFGSVVTNTTAQKTVTLTNSGTTSIEITNAYVTGATSALSLSGWNGSVSVMPGHSYTLAVNFAPRWTGSFPGYAVFVLNVGSTSAYLTGTGVVAATPPPPVAVSVSPTSATVVAGASQKYTASVSGTTNTAVLWYAGGIQGGNASVGTISSSGIYTAPATVPGNPQVTISAISTADPTKGGNATANLVASSNGHDLYVSTSGSDSNPGTLAAPWRTISKAAKVAVAGDTVHVLPGTYAESVIINSAGGTPNAHIRFISDQKWAAKITGGGSDRAAFRVQTGPYIDVIGFEVTNNHPYPAGTQGIEMYASGGRILGNHIHDVPGGCALTPMLGGAGIHTYPQNTTDVDIIGNVVHNIGNYLDPQNCQLTHGIYIESNRARIENNLVYRNQAWGIHMFHTPYNDTVTNNVTFENGYGGIIVEGSCTEYAGGSGMNDYTTVSNNIVINNGYHGAGGRGGIIEDGCTGSNNVYYNNIVHNNLRYNVVSNWYLLTGTKAGNIDADPQFVNYQGDGTGDYHLVSISPGINAGTTAGAALGFNGPPKYDIAGGARPVGSGIDIGVYEMGSTPATWPWY